MKLQLAIDRVSIDQALKIISEAENYIDIIEIGTSLIKDYGLISVQEIKKAFPSKIILADIKTVDEAQYEFDAIYNAGADIATVLGVSSLETIGICRRVARKYNKEYMIDLLETSVKRQIELKQFDDAILCIHLPSDKNREIVSLINNTLSHIKEFPRLSVAGGVNMQNITDVKRGNFEIVIIGGAITKSDNVKQAAQKFKMLMEDV